ncbi:MAG: anti-sigma factor domain-containing protein [Spirochaetaceae bacterium]|jgi:hypothetical protein|nr:anti-sigma factor domain-containing protein [Spirochaetaceae bacterium]
MKGIIWKIEGQKSIVLFQNGDFRAVPTPPDAQTGMTVTVSYNRKRMVLFAAVLFAAVAAAVSGTVLYFSPAGYIDIIVYAQEDDRRIIVEFAANRFDRILEIRHFSTESSFAESLPPLKYKDIDEACADALKAASLFFPSAKESQARIQITHRNIQRAQELKTRFTRIIESIEEMTGRRLLAAFKVETLN